jgi:hypothetical protein
VNRSQGWIWVWLQPWSLWMQWMSVVSLSC